MNEKIMSETSEILMQKYGCNLSEITPEANIFHDLGMDSLDALEFSLELEKHFNVHMDDDKVSDLETIGKITAYVEELLVESGEQYSYDANVGHSD